MNKTTVKKRKRVNPVYECEYCGQMTAHKSLLNHTFGKMPNLIVITNVETMVCENCGQSYLEGDTLAAVAEVLAKPKTYTAARSVAVAELAA